MSWQERVDKYKAEQAEAARREREARLASLREKVPPLLEVLDKLNCVELLTQIRDEVWRLGEVSVFPKLDEVTAETPILAGACLIAEWPFYSPAGGFGEYDYSSRITISCHRLSIVAQYGGCRLVEDSDDILLGVTEVSDNLILPQEFFTNGPFFKASEPNAKFLLEKLLVEDLSKRDCPYDRLKRQDERGVVQAIIKEGLKPPKGFEYLSKLAEAEKARRGNR